MIPTQVHAALDGLSAATLVLGASALDWPAGLRGPVAAAGFGVAAYSLATRYRPDPGGPLSMQAHLVLDAVQGVGFCAAAALLAREAPKVRIVLGGYGLFSLAAVLLSDVPEESHDRMPRQVQRTPASVAPAVRNGRHDRHPAQSAAGAFQ